MDFHDVFMKLYPQRANGVEPEKIPWEDKDYIFQIKEDGDRRLLYILDSGNRNTSRSKGADTGLPVEKTDNVPHIRDLKIPDLHGTILDVEFIHPLGFQDGVRKIMGCLPEKAIERQKEMGLIEVYVFDIICMVGDFLIDDPLEYRMEVLEEVFNGYFKDIPFFKLVKAVEGTKEELIQKFEEIVANGGEGLVAKRRNSTYRLSTQKCLSPLKNAWIKIKREFNGDFVVTGFEAPNKIYTGDHLETHQYWDEHNLPVTKYYHMGWIGGIKFGEYENGVLIERGTCSGMTEEVRAEISANPDKYIGKVIEVDAMQRTKDKALRQPVFKRFRDDKKPEECIYDNQKG